MRSSYTNKQLRASYDFSIYLKIINSLIYKGLRNQIRCELAKSEQNHELKTLTFPNLLQSRKLNTDVEIQLAYAKLEHLHFLSK